MIYIDEINEFEDVYSVSYVLDQGIVVEECGSRDEAIDRYRELERDVRLTAVTVASTFGEFGISR